MNRVKHLQSKFELFEMANFRGKTTGLPFNIWITEKSGREKHGPRIKVQCDHSQNLQIENTVTVTVSSTPLVIGGGLSTEDTKLVTQFIQDNMTALLQYWNGEIDASEFSSNLKKN